MTLKIPLAYLLIQVQDVMSNTALLVVAFHIDFAQVDNNDNGAKQPHLDVGPDRRAVRCWEPRVDQGEESGRRCTDGEAPFCASTLSGILIHHWVIMTVGFLVPVSSAAQTGDIWLSHTVLHIHILKCTEI